jgi:hypothetical protein
MQPAGKQAKRRRALMLTDKELYGGFKTPLDREPPQLALNKKLATSVAPTGAFTTKEHDPLHPVTTEQIVDAVLSSTMPGLRYGTSTGSTSPFLPVSQGSKQVLFVGIRIPSRSRIHQYS